MFLLILSKKVLSHMRLPMVINVHAVDTQNNAGKM